MLLQVLRSIRSRDQATQPVLPLHHVRSGHSKIVPLPCIRTAGQADLDTVAAALLRGQVERGVAGVVHHQVDIALSVIKQHLKAFLTAIAGGKVHCVVPFSAQFVWVCPHLQQRPDGGQVALPDRDEELVLEHCEDHLRGWRCTWGVAVIDPVHKGWRWGGRWVDRSRLVVELWWGSAL